MFEKKSVANLTPITFTGSPGHHKWFTHNAECRALILRSANFIQKNGVRRYLEMEYPNPDIKQIILNQIDGRYFVTDGNKHLVSLILARPDLTLGELISYHPALLRIWTQGFEKPGQTEPYSTYIPISVDTRNLSNARIGTDYSKKPPEDTRIIGSDIPFDSPLFLPEDRGRPLYETALVLVSRRIAAVM